MKRVIYIIIGLNLVGGGKTFADDSLTGLHLGFGLNVSADEYKSDVDVLGTTKYDDGSGAKWTFTGPERKVIVSGTYTIGTMKDCILLEVVKDNANCNIENDKIRVVLTEVDNYSARLSKVEYNKKNNMWRHANTPNGTNGLPEEAIIVDGPYQSGTTVTLENVPVNVRNGKLTTGIVDEIIDYRNSTKDNTIRDICGDDLLVELNNRDYPGICESEVHYTLPDKAIMNIKSSKQFKHRAARVNGEIKASYFFKLFNNIIAGVDVSGTVPRHTAKNVETFKINGKINDAQYDVNKSTYKIGIEGDDYREAKGYIEYKPNDEGQYGFYSVGNLFLNGEQPYQGADEVVFFKTIFDKPNHFPNMPAGYTYTGILFIPELDYVIEEVPLMLKQATTSEFKAANPGYTEISNPDLSQYLQISNEKCGDVSFEKNKFNSRAAVVLGAQYKGWFAGVRGGISYNQGKLHVKDSTGTSSEEVSFASPFVGVHLMKSVNMKGLENGHIYVTADVNVQNKQNLKMKGIKNFRQNSVNVSLGMTWQIN